MCHITAQQIPFPPSIYGACVCMPFTDCWHRGFREKFRANLELIKLFWSTHRPGLTMEMDVDVNLDVVVVDMDKDTHPHTTQSTAQIKQIPTHPLEFTHYEIHTLKLGSAVGIWFPISVWEPRPQPFNAWRYQKCWPFGWNREKWYIYWDELGWVFTWAKDI